MYSFFAAPFPRKRGLTVTWRCATSVQVAFEVRVEPGSYKRGPASLVNGAPVTPPSSFGASTEWYTDRTSAVFLSALLVRVTDWDDGPTASPSAE